MLGPQDGLLLRRDGDGDLDRRTGAGAAGEWLRLAGVRRRREPSVTGVHAGPGAPNASSFRTMRVTGCQRPQRLAASEAPRR